MEAMRARTGDAADCYSGMGPVDVPCHETLEAGGMIANVGPAGLASRPCRRAKSFLTLLVAIKQWAASRGASPVFFHVMTGVRLVGTDRLMKAVGARCVGGRYVG